MYQTLQYREDAAVATIQLNRPQKKNSLNAQMRTEMETLLHDLARKAGIRAVIITGGDEIFCAGADIGEIEGTSSAEAAYQHAREFQILFDQVESLPQPVIAAVSGWALGGGCELALAADFRIAAETARFGLPEIKIGAFPGGGGTQRLSRLIGVAKAKEMILTGDPITAQEALAIRLSHDGSRERAINGVRAATCGEARGVAPACVAGVEDADQSKPGSRLGDWA